MDWQRERRERQDQPRLVRLSSVVILMNTYTIYLFMPSLRRLYTESDYLAWFDWIRAWTGQRDEKSARMVRRHSLYGSTASVSCAL